MGIWKDWRAKRVRKRQDRRAAAHDLLTANPETAYYDAQRLAARARFAGDRARFHFWAQVAAEIARISENPMDYGMVDQIVQEEQRAAENLTK